MNWGLIFLSLLLTVVSYMAFPMIKLMINHGRFEKKRAKKIALWNSIIVGAIFCVLTFALSEPGGTAWNAAPAFFYYLINCVVLTDKNAEAETAEIERVAIEAEAEVEKREEFVEMPISTDLKPFSRKKNKLRVL